MRQFCWRKSIVLTENSLIGDVLDAEPETDGERGCSDVQVEEERDPCGWLVLGNGRNDRNVNLQPLEIIQELAQDSYLKKKL